MSEVTSNFPQLRFPDFDDKWEEKRLSDIAEKSNVKNRDNEVSSVFTNSATKGVVNQRDFFDKDIVNQNNLDGYYIINHDNFVYNPRISFSAPVGPLNRNHLGTGVMSPLYTILKINNVSLDFIERYFKTTKWHRYMNNIANIGARHDRMNIISSDFMKMPIPLPKDEEQQKIAASLAAVDNKIEQLSKKQELLGEYKKGLMQQIFSQEIRFKADDGSDFPDWEDGLLNTLIDNSRKIRYGIVQPGKYDKNGKYLIRGKDYSNGWEIPSEFFKVSDAIEKKYSKTRVKKGDVIVCIVGSVGNVMVIPGWLDGANITQTTARIAPDKNKLNNQYLYFYFQSLVGRNMIHKHTRVGTRPGLNIEDVEKFSILLPSLLEQAKIANFLSSIDNKIEQVGKQLDESKQFKKALLQQMFV